MSAREKAQHTDVELGTRENNAHLDALSEQVAMLKGLTADIDGEVRSQNDFLEGMGSGMGGAGHALSRTMAAFESMSARGNARFGMLVAGAVVGLFVLAWWGLTRVGAAPPPTRGAP